MAPTGTVSQSRSTPHLTVGTRWNPLSPLRRSGREPSQYGWRFFIPCLFIYMTFEGLLRRSFPLYNLQILLLKDSALAVFYGYFLLCVQPTMPAWRKRDGVLTFLAVLFVVLNAVGIVRAGFAILPVVLGLKANFWYVPIFFIGRYYFASCRQIREFWFRLAWLLIPVAGMAIWQVFFGHFDQLVFSSGTMDSESWAAAGRGTLRNNTDGTLIATVSSTFFGGRLAIFAAVWLLIMFVLCVTDRNRESKLRQSYLYVSLAGALVALFVSANRAAVGLAIACLAVLVVVMARRHSFRFLIRGAGIAVLFVAIFGTYRAARSSDALEEQLRAFTTFFSGFLDAPGPDVRGSRYSVIGTDILRGIELSLTEVGPLGCGLGRMTQGAVYIDADAQRVFDVQTNAEAQADSQWVRLVIELGIPGLVVYLLIAARVLWRLTRVALRIRRKSWADGLTVALGPVLLLLYLGFAHKHAGFAEDPMFQCYALFAAGASFGVAARKPFRQQNSAWSARGAAVS